MICAICLSGGGQYYAEGNPTELRLKIEQNTEIECWWYESHGARQKETFLFLSDSISVIRTECETSIIEEL